MAKFSILPDVDSLAHAAVELATGAIEKSLADHGNATWVLAGGSSPAVAYRELAAKHRATLDWQRVRVLMGDERCVPQDHSDSNWGQVAGTLLPALGIPPTNQVRPKGELSPEDAAVRYEEALSQLPTTSNGLPRLDHVWLGIGEDGHTLSLFPGHESSWDPARLVIAIHNSPKPPPQRITLTLRALKGTASCLVFAAGKGKASIVARAQANDETLPIVRAVHAVESAGGSVTWLVDRAAADG